MRIPLKLTFKQLLLLLVVVIYTETIQPGDVSPFRTRNQNPFVSVYGLPVIGNSRILEKNQRELGLVLDITNNFTGSRSGVDTVIIDGESYRMTLDFNIGKGNGFQYGIQIPFIYHSSGQFDTAIRELHKIFGLSSQERELVADNQLQYTYHDQAGDQLTIDTSTGGIGDLFLSVGYQLSKTQSLNLALYGGLKLATGSASDLTGSGSTDFSAQVVFGKSLVHIPVELYGSIGVLGIYKSKLIADKVKDWLPFASLGIGWRVVPDFHLKVQIEYNDAFYQDTQLTPLSDAAYQITVGTSFFTHKGLQIDLAISEDELKYNSSPDVTFHGSIIKHF
jgi:hypothetical protein